MSSVANNQLNSLVVARRLMIAAQEFEDERHGKKVHRKDAQETMAEDQALISGEAKGAQKANDTQPAQTQASGTDLKLGDLIQQLRQVQGQPAPTNQTTAAASDQTSWTAIEVQQKEELSIKIQYASLPRVDGLVVRDQNSAETDRYAFDFQSGQSLKITDKWTGKYTRVWGDPHVDTSDQEGESNGDFSDLKGSNSQTTMMLQDGTRVTFTAKDNGLIEKVDVFKGNQHLAGTGAGLKDYQAESGMFAKSVDTASPSGLPMGDTVYAGGDGADWYDAAGKLVWGKTTGPGASTRPNGILQMSYQHTFTQQVTVQTVTATA